MKGLVSYLKSLILGALAVYATWLIFVLPKNPARWAETIRFSWFLPILAWCLVPVALFPLWQWFLRCVLRKRSVFVQSFFYVIVCLLATVMVLGRLQHQRIPPKKWVKVAVAGLVASMATTLVSKMEFFEGRAPAGGDAGAGPAEGSESA